VATYISLINFTDQGIRNIKDTTKRADAAIEVAKKYGINAKEFFWTVGNYDMVVISDAPDDKSFAAWGLSLSSSGNVRMQTLRAFSKEDMNGILAKMI
jgi:uncharacterized protein with GYD domain